MIVPVYTTGYTQNYDHVFGNQIIVFYVLAKVIFDIFSSTNGIVVKAAIRRNLVFNPK